MNEYRFDAEVWLWESRPAWHFLSVPPDVSDDIEARAAGVERGFGSVRVQVSIGHSTWRTSVFPDTKRGAYVLPLKSEVRRREDIAEGDTVTVGLELVDL